MFAGLPVILGTANFGTSVSVGDAYEIMDTFAELGGRTIDTANVYACWHPVGQGGDSERVIGNWLQKRGDRTAFTIVTKIGSFPACGDSCNTEGLSPESIYAAVEKSMARLNVKQIDVLLAHHDDYITPLHDTWKAFTELVECGKVKRVGISNYLPGRVAELASVIERFSLVPISVVELKYSIIDPIKNADFGKLCLLDERMQIVLQRVVPETAIFGYSPLLRGLFEKDIKSGWPAEYDTVVNRKYIMDIQVQANKIGVSSSALVIKKILEKGIFPVIGVSKNQQLKDNLMSFVLHKQLC